MARSIEENALQALVSAHAVREVRAHRHGDVWRVSVRLGASWSPIRSRREPIREWRSLTAVGRFLDAQGITQFQVEL